MAIVPVIDPAAASDLAAEFSALDQDINRAHQFAIDALRNPRPPEPTTLWHYTNAEGLLGIIKGRELWMSHIATMNDREEYLHGLQYILKDVDDRLSGTCPGAAKKILPASRGGGKGLDGDREDA